MKNQVTIKHEIGGLKKVQSPCKILDLEKKGILLNEDNSHVWTIKCETLKAYPPWINFCVDLISRIATSIDFAHIDFREQPNAFRVDLISQ